KAMRFAEVVKYCTVVSLGRGAYFSRAMNRDSWQRLPPDLREILDASASVWSEASIDELIVAADNGHKLGVERGVEFIQLPVAELAEVRELYAEMARARAQDMLRFGLPGHDAYAVAQSVIASWNAEQPR
ncbi:MAG TPA: hypothetical protein VK629_12815, partial [Steroidobacteraceae bacterium]|nr:hypothetical protein [Steroidobacteraceae bacterium]